MLSWQSNFLGWITRPELLQCCRGCCVREPVTGRGVEAVFALLMSPPPPAGKWGQHACSLSGALTSPPPFLRWQPWSPAPPGLRERCQTIHSPPFDGEPLFHRCSSTFDQIHWPSGNQLTMIIPYNLWAKWLNKRTLTSRHEQPRIICTHLFTFIWMSINDRATVTAGLLICFTAVRQG